MEGVGMVQESKVVVGLDFGTTFSGFAYAHRADPDNIYTFYDWPMQAEGGGLPYCKTQTSLLYADASDSSGDDLYELREWGWPAYVQYKSKAAESTSDASMSQSMHSLSLSGGRKKPSDSHYFVKLFKLHLATRGSSFTSSTASSLPLGLTVRRAITDYLREISKFILQEVRDKFGTHISLDDIEWCLTVPAIWDEHAKKEMRMCSEMAGLVQGPHSKDDAASPHPLKLFIEPEAASVYCQQKLEGHGWKKGDKLLVVDCGGGTVDLVLHEKLGSHPLVSVREVQESTGELCGGSQIDEEFFRFLRYKINCFERFEREYPATVLAFCQEWQKVKSDYAGDAKDVHVELPPALAAMWEDSDPSANSSNSYDEIKLTNADMRSIFDPVVNKILLLVFPRLTVSNLAAILVVGGFSASLYLMRRIRETFGGRVSTITSPPFPGSAVCCGAVTLGIRSDTVVSRISKKTYGTNFAIPFIPGVHPVSSRIEGSFGRAYCQGTFKVFVRKGDEVAINDCVKKVFGPIIESQTEIDVHLYSTDCQDVTYVTDPGVQLEGAFSIGFRSQLELGFKPRVEVSMFFGRSEIQVTGVGLNFDSQKKEMLPVKFERHAIY